MPDGLESGRRAYPDGLDASATDLLHLLALGLTNREIAGRVGVSIPTARWRIRRLFIKLGVRNRIEAIESAFGGHPQQLRAMAIPPLSPTPEAPKKVELEILRLLSRGMKRDEIANDLALPLSNVKWYMHGIYSKLKVRNRIEALARARHLNWL